MGMGPPPPPTWGSPAGPGSAIGSAVGGPPSSVGGPPGSAIGAPSSSLGIPGYSQPPHSPGAGPSSPYGAPSPFGAPSSPYGAPTPYGMSPPGPSAPGPGYPAPAAVASPYGGAAPVPPFAGGHGANLGHPTRDVRGEHMRPHLDRMAMSDVGAAPPSHHGGSDVGLRHAVSEVGTRAAPGAPYPGYGTPPPQQQQLAPRGYPPRQQLQPHGDGGSDVGSNLSVHSAGGGVRRVPSRGEGSQGQYNPRQRSPSPMRMAPPGAGRPGY
ncbi:hypothetical protein AMAG_16674 [Allomyces macrogynus ATCC 38327]|uniref:Uncharacterized protein n=1 Tax=Allomyces macrogynus (strain ATCC 38327) TaxID=578462 RepID=A0A0L0TBK7_ALLM3|nr:hypothetical protein AMAG_16674 [Allomyces macrogynus ATCC 38327]|eukprot:KNE72188.1 hypothetical protein AMAG_16674 [Allomyces macrogynus ATCC 38327]